MFRRKIWLNNQEEFQEMIQKLESLEIPYMSHKIDDSSTPLIVSANSFWALSFPENYSRKFFRNTEGDVPTEIFTTDEAHRDAESPAKSFLPSFLRKNLLSLYAILVTLFFIRYLHLNYLNSESKNFSYSWTLDNTHNSVQHKEDHGMKTIFIDENYDLNFERTEVYVKNKRVGLYVDEDENGIQETSIEYNLAGKRWGIAYDKNQDGLFERWTIELEDGRKIELIDSNQDGNYEWRGEKEDTKAQSK